MADETNFADLGALFHQGMQGLGSKKATYAMRVGKEVEFDAALTNAGKKFVEYFDSKLEHGDSEWPGVPSETTLNIREDYGINSLKELNATGALKKALTYQVTGRHTLEVGMKNELHERPDGYTGKGADELISMEDLVVLMELGYTTASDSMVPGRFVPPRPIFTSSDFDETAELIALEFAEEVLNRGKVSAATWRATK